MQACEIPIKIFYLIYNYKRYEAIEVFNDINWIDERRC